MSVAEKHSEVQSLLLKGVRKAVGEHFRSASPFCTRQSISLRVIRDVCNILQVPFSVIQDTKNLIPIHVDISRMVEYIWAQQYSSQPPQLEDANLMEKFLAKDYARPSELVKLANLLDKKITLPDCRHQLNLIFAVDGFHEFQLKDYIENMKYGFGGENVLPHIHVQAVRQLYQLTLEPKVIFEVLQKTFKKEEAEEHVNLQSTYKEYVGEYLEGIIAWKIPKPGSETEKKKTCGRKRKIPVDEKEKKVKKVSAAPIGDKSASEAEESERKKKTPKEDMTGLKKMRKNHGKDKVIRDESDASDSEEAKMRERKRKMLKEHTLVTKKKKMMALNEMVLDKDESDASDSDEKKTELRRIKRLPESDSESDVSENEDNVPEKMSEPTVCEESG